MNKLNSHTKALIYKSTDILEILEILESTYSQKGALSPKQKHLFTKALFPSYPALASIMTTHIFIQ